MLRVRTVGTFGKKSYDIQVTTLQAVALMAFNVTPAEATSGLGSSPKTFSSLLDSLQMPEEALKRVMHSLSCGKLKVLKRIAATAVVASSAASASAIAVEGEVTGDAAGEKDKGSSGAAGNIKATDSFVFNEQFR